MIKFFRRIRQQLVTEKKISKYLLYAIGEILLVVFGILIALYLNTKKEIIPCSQHSADVCTTLQKGLSGVHSCSRRGAQNANLWECPSLGISGWLSGAN